MSAFAPQGDTVNIAVTGTAQTLTLPTGTGNMRLANEGPQTVFLHFQSTATLANGMRLLPNTVEVFGKGSLGSISVIAAAVGSTLSATTGEGE